MKRYASTLFVFLLTACAAQTGVVNIGQDTYMVGRQGWISTQSVTQLKGEAFQEAARFCTSQGKSIQPISSKDMPGAIGRSYPEAEIQFRCLAPNDSELSRPTLTKVPDVIIQNK
jgi:hypothetical protein